MRLQTPTRDGPPIRVTANPAATLPHAHRHFTRRHFIRGAAGAVAVGAAATTSLLRAPSAEARTPMGNQIVPIPYGLDFFDDGTIYRVEAPPFPGFGEDPSTIFNFEGASAITFSDGLVDRTNRKSGVVETLPFIASDMRFMQGTYADRHGKVRSGTFGFV